MSSGRVTAEWLWLPLALPLDFWEVAWHDWAQ